MSVFLIVEDEQNHRDQWSKWLQQKGHSTVHAIDVFSGIEVFQKIEQQLYDEPDLILLDHGLGDDYGISLIDDVVKRKIFSEEYFRDRIILITGSHNISLGPEYTRRGAIGSLIKPVSEPQFWMTIESALEYRRLFVDQMTDWEQAIKVLEDQGFLKPLEDLQGIQDSYNGLKETYEKLIEDIRSASGNKQHIAEAYTKAYNALESSLVEDIGNISEVLQNFKYTDRFIEDIQNVYSRDKLYFFIFQSYLSRIASDPRSLRSRNLKVTENRFFEYRIGREYRLYFCYADSKIEFHRLTRKTEQKDTLTYLTAMA